MKGKSEWAGALRWQQCKGSASLTAILTTPLYTTVDNSGEERRGSDKDASVFCCLLLLLHWQCKHLAEQVYTLHVGGEQVQQQQHLWWRQAQGATSATRETIATVSASPRCRQLVSRGEDGWAPGDQRFNIFQFPSIFNEVTWDSISFNSLQYSTRWSEIQLIENWGWAWARWC